MWISPLYKQQGKTEEGCLMNHPKLAQLFWKKREQLKKIQRKIENIVMTREIPGLNNPQGIDMPLNK